MFFLHTAPGIIVQRGNGEHQHDGGKIVLGSVKKPDRFQASVLPRQLATAPMIHTLPDEIFFDRGTILLSGDLIGSQSQNPCTHLATAGTDGVLSWYYTV